MVRFLEVRRQSNSTHFFGRRRGLAGCTHYDTYDSCMMRVVSGHADACMLFGMLRFITDDVMR